MRITTTTRWRSASAVKEYHINVVQLRNSREVFFRAIDIPIRTHVATILGSIGETKHNSLLVAPLG